MTRDVGVNPWLDEGQYALANWEVSCNWDPALQTSPAWPGVNAEIFFALNHLLIQPVFPDKSLKGILCGKPLVETPKSS